MKFTIARKIAEIKSGKVAFPLKAVNSRRTRLKAQNPYSNIPKIPAASCPESTSPKIEIHAGTVRLKNSGKAKLVQEESSNEQNLENGLSGSESSEIQRFNLNTKSGTVIMLIYGNELKKGLKSVEPIPITKNLEPKKNLKVQNKTVRIELQ